MTDFIDLPDRKDVPEALTWDLSDLFASDDDYHRAFQELQDSLPELKAYQGSLNQGGQAFFKALEAILDSGRQLERVYLYAHLKNDQDTSNATYQEMYDEARGLYSSYATEIAWFESEVLSLDEDMVKTYMEEEKDLALYDHYLERIYAKKKHRLDQDQEALLAAAGEVMSSSSQTFSTLNNSDLDFPVIENDQGEQVKLSHGNYSLFLESQNRDVRKDALESYYSVYEALENTFASTLSGTVKQHNFNAKIRHYDSARQAALSANFIPEEVYDQLIDRVHAYLPAFHRYLAVRKKALELDDLHMYDMYVPLADSSDFNYSYEQAQAITLEALKPLGEEYQAILREAFDQRWIDVCENKGKRSGAYSSGNYDSKPYILLNWHDSLNNLYTLVHELGHSVHTYLTNQNQPYIYGDYPIFLAEIASTTNENLLTAYLLDQAKTDQEKIVILNQYLDGFKGTVFRQTQFAEFEHLIHEKQASGQALSAQYLNDQYYQLNQVYYGDDVVSDPQIAKEWSRIPHFYYNYYVYQYATGFCAASALAQQVLSGKEGLEAYLGFLKAGQSDYPIQVMKEAGVDMTKSDYLNEAFETFVDYLDQLEALV